MINADPLKHVWSEKFISNEKGKIGQARELGVWRDEVLKRCSESRHLLSSLVMGAGGAWVSAPPAPWCRALVSTEVVHHQFDLRHQRHLVDG